MMFLVGSLEAWWTISTRYSYLYNIRQTAIGEWTREAGGFLLFNMWDFFLILWCFRETSRQFQEDRQVVSTDHPIPILENRAIRLTFLQLRNCKHISKWSPPGKLWASSTAQISVGGDYTPGQPAAAECCKHTKKHVDMLKTVVKPIIFTSLVYLNIFKDKEQTIEIIYQNSSC